MIYVIFRWKKGGNESALSANYLQGDTWLCKHPEIGHGFWGGTGTQKPCCFLACNGISEALSDPEHRKQTWAMLWHCLKLIEMGFREMNTAMFQNWCEYGLSLPKVMDLTGGPDVLVKPWHLRKVNLSGLSLRYLNLRLYLLWPPRCAVVNVMELQAPSWIIHLLGTGLFLLQHEADDEGQ